MACNCEFCTIFRRVKDNPYPAEGDMNNLSWIEELELEDMLKAWYVRVFVDELKFRENEDMINDWLEDNCKCEYDIQDFISQKNCGTMITFFYNRNDNGEQAKKDAMLFKLKWG